MVSSTMRHFAVNGVYGSTINVVITSPMELSSKISQQKRRREKKFIVSMAGANPRIKQHETEVFEEKLSSYRKGNKRSRANSWSQELLVWKQLLS